MNELRARLRELFPPDTRRDWDDVLRRARSDRRVPRILIPLSALIVAVLLVGSALALTGRLGGLFHGKPVKDLTPAERFTLSEFGSSGKVELIATRGSRAFYVLPGPNGRICYATGITRHGLTPAQAALRSRFGSMGCLARGTFPSRAVPVLDFSYYELRRGDSEQRLVGLEGFAADPVAKVGVIGRDNRVVYSVPVDDNVYSARNVGIRGARGLLAVDEKGKLLWVQCMHRGGCGKYKTSPPPAASRSVRPPRPRRLRTPVQSGTGDGVQVTMRGTLLEANLTGISPRVEQLLIGRRHKVSIGCFKLVRVSGKAFVRGYGTSTPFASIVRAEIGLGRFGRPFTPPLDGCTITGQYGHTWNDALGTHDPIEVPLSAKGRRFFTEQAVARDIAWLARARVFKAVRYAQRPFTSASAAAYLAKRVDPLSGPSATAPVGHLGIWLGPDRRIVLVERAPTGRRLFLELRRGVIYRTNLIGLAGVL